MPPGRWSERWHQRGNAPRYRRRGTRMPKAVQIRLLGELEVTREGRALSLPASKKTRALLAYLAATARPHLRQSLCELLWPGPDDPRAALRWTLTKIRDVVDEEGVARIAADRD